MLQRVPRYSGHAAAEELAQRLLHEVPKSPSSADRVLLATQAFDMGLSERCPALDAEQRCSLHTSRKPAICKVVPLDAWLPDELQHRVLAMRAAEARYVGSDCIAPGARPGFALVTRRLTVVENDARAALAERRRDLEKERSFWGKSVFALLVPELFPEPAALGRLPASGFITLSLAPVLLVLADASPRCRARCIAYLDAQGQLAQRLLADAAAHGHSQSEAVRRLGAFAGSNARLRQALAAGLPAHSSPLAHEQAAVEAWLGLV